MTNISMASSSEAGAETGTDTNEYHLAQLKCRCRVCACICRKYCHSTTKVSDKFSMPKDLQEAFGIEVSQDNPEVHPQTVCNNCYLKMRQKLKNKNTNSSLQMFQWVHHTQCCPQCHLFQQEEVGGRPKGKQPATWDGTSKLAVATASFPIFFHPTFQFQRHPATWCPVPFLLNVSWPSSTGCMWTTSVWYMHCWLHAEQQWVSGTSLLWWSTVQYQQLI